PALDLARAGRLEFLGQGAEKPEVEAAARREIDRSLLREIDGPADLHPRAAALEDDGSEPQPPALERRLDRPQRRHRHAGRRALESIERGARAERLAFGQGPLDLGPAGDDD